MRFSAPKTAGLDPQQPLHDANARRWVWCVGLAALCFFTANAGKLTLLALDDCFYARKGVEMARHGLGLIPAWDQTPSLQNPPLPFWMLAAANHLVGEGNLAARIPSALMACGIFCMTFRIGKRLLDRDTAVVGSALLLVTPLFFQNARRCMLEIPNAFWVTLFILLYVESRQRPRWALALGLPLAGTLLTKSVLGLLPVLVVGVHHAVLQRGKRPAARYALLGTAAGLVLGAIWPWALFRFDGLNGLRAHYGGEVATRSTQAWSLAGLLFDYPRILLVEFEPVVLPGLIGAGLALRRWRARRPCEDLLLAVWVLVSVVCCSVSSARSARYIFPILAPLSLLAARVLLGVHRRGMLWFARWVVPAACVAGAAIYWIRPALMTRNENAVFVSAAAEVQSLVPEGRRIPILGAGSWRLYNPLLFYAERAALPNDSLPVVLRQAREFPRPVFLVERTRLDDLRNAKIAYQPHLKLGDWTLVEVPRGAR